MPSPLTLVASNCPSQQRASFENSAMPGKVSRRPARGSVGYFATYDDSGDFICPITYARQPVYWRLPDGAVNYLGTSRPQMRWTAYQVTFSHFFQALVPQMKDRREWSVTSFLKWLDAHCAVEPCSRGYGFCVQVLKPEDWFKDPNYARLLETSDVRA